MKYIILAAGKGTRTGLDKPKVLIQYKGKTLLAHHFNCAELYNLEPFVVGGYKSDELPYVSVVNKNYESTNMVESFMLSYDTPNEDVVVAYGDIVYNPIILQNLLEKTQDFVIIVDKDWKTYWKLRYNDINEDIESLSIIDGFISELGDPNPILQNIDARYVGLMKFSKKALGILREIYDSNEKWKTAFMTDLLQEVIKKGYKIKAMEIENMWLEFDTYNDIINADENGKKLNV